MKTYRKGTKVPFAYGAEYRGENNWTIVKKDYNFTGEKVRRFTITNGVTTINGVKEKEFYAA